jgi:hypothetical protein
MHTKLEIDWDTTEAPEMGFPSMLLQIAPQIFVSVPTKDPSDSTVDSQWLPQVDGFGD